MASSSSSHKLSFTAFERETLTGSSSKKIYDAFINHRGPDVKGTVAFALYDSLEEKECWTFLDDQELQLGDSISSAIKDAIYSSRVQIAIFSPRYAESPWCLDELLLMLKTKALFIPVFCDVKPSDLRYPDKGIYAAAFAQHVEKKRFSSERLQQWKEALDFSSHISGYEFITSNDNVERLCTKITLAVQKEVGKTFEGCEASTSTSTQEMRYTQQLHLSSCVCEIPRHLIESITHADEAVSTTTLAKVKKSSLLPRDSHPVGIESKVEDMVGLLEDPTIQVIAVVGMGGSGKTFLLQNVYKAVKSKYDRSVWLSISKSYSLKNLQHDIASHIGLESEIVNAKVTEERSAELIHDRLQEKRSLIVLDDLWTLSTENTLIDKLGLPADKDCKIVISTRNRQVALNSNARIYEMKNLSDEDSWKLFCAYAFQDPEGNRAPQDIKKEGRKIVKQCGNLPLAIKTIAASLANTQLLRKWELKRRQLERVVTPVGDPDPVMEILKLSYDSLPAHLKPCFAYLSFFPEDEKIETKYLINLWIGEGFIPKGEDQWDMAWDWLDQLAQLCLIQLNERHLEDFTQFCQIHDLLHDLAIHISKEKKCVFSVEEISRHTSGATGWCRILLAKKGAHVNDISDSHPVYLRTLSLSRNPEITSIPESLFTSMRGLRVLDLRFTSISTLPDSVGKMILLRVLNFSHTEIAEVPECVRNLKSLLYLGVPEECELPEWIGELECLQYLSGEYVCLPKGIAKLTSLRTFTYCWDFSIEDKFMGVGDLGNMTQLEELWLDVENEMELKRIEGVLEQLVKMRRLHIENKTGKGTGLPESTTAMKHLEILQVEGFVVPSCICYLANLTYLHIVNCDCSNYPELQAMPNLMGLQLYNNGSCRELPKAFGKAGGFPQLRCFKIDNFSSLEQFPELEEGAMACLEDFHLGNCPKVEKVEGLEEGAMACLENFKLYGCPRVDKVEGLERLKRLKLFEYVELRRTNEWVETLKEGGEYWHKIKDINPHVTIDIFQF